MTLALTLAALRRHPFSVSLSALLIVTTASLLHVSAPLALAIWAAAGLVSIELWCALEPFLLRRICGLRLPSHTELSLLDAALVRHSLQPLLSDEPDLALGRGIRCMVVTRDVLEVLDEQALIGLLHQACAPVHCANLAGLLLVWLGALPILIAWHVSRWLVRLGQLLGLVVGQSLVLPLVLWPGAFVRWSGRVFGSVIVGLLGSMLLSRGFAAAGLGLMIAWIVVPSVRMLLAWESSRIERAADRSTIEAGFGSQLLEALDFLVLAEPRPIPRGLLGVLSFAGAGLIERASRIRKVLSAP
jgi:hypothetical protein